MPVDSSHLIQAASAWRQILAWVECWVAEDEWPLVAYVLPPHDLPSMNGPGLRIAGSSPRVVQLQAPERESQGEAPP